MGKMYLYHTSDVLWFSVACFWCQSFGDIDSNSNVSKYLLLKHHERNDVETSVPSRVLDTSLNVS